MSDGEMAGQEGSAHRSYSLVGNEAVSKIASSRGEEREVFWQGWCARLVSVKLNPTFDLYHVRLLYPIKMKCCENYITIRKKWEDGDGWEEGKRNMWRYYASGWAQTALGVRMCVCETLGVLGFVYLLITIQLWASRECVRVCVCVRAHILERRRSAALCMMKPCIGYDFCLSDIHIHAWLCGRMYKIVAATLTA